MCRYTHVTTLPDSPDGLVPIEANVALLEYKGLNILLDGGGGDFIPEQGTLPAQLAVLGLGVEDIDHVLITHGCAASDIMASIACSSNARGAWMCACEL